MEEKTKLGSRVAGGIEERILELGGRARPLIISSCTPSIFQRGEPTKNGSTTRVLRLDQGCTLCGSIPKIDELLRQSARRIRGEQSSRHTNERIAKHRTVGTTLSRDSCKIGHTNQECYGP